MHANKALFKETANTETATVCESFVTKQTNSLTKYDLKVHSIDPILEMGNFPDFSRNIRISQSYWSDQPSIFLALNFYSLTDCQKLWHNCSLFVNTSFDTN